MMPLPEDFEGLARLLYQMGASMPGSGIPFSPEGFSQTLRGMPGAMAQGMQEHPLAAAAGIAGLPPAPAAFGQWASRMGRSTPLPMLSLPPESGPLLVQTLREIQHGRPTTFMGWHGTNTPESVIAREGFRIPSHEQNPLVPRIQGKLGGREGFFDKGVYFTDVKKMAEGYGEPLPIQVQMQNPYQLGHTSFAEIARLEPRVLRGEGFDALIASGGRYGMHGESYRQGAAWNPSAVSVFRGEFNPGYAVVGQKVVNPLTGERGVVRNVRPLSIEHSQYWPEGTTANLEVRWSGIRGGPKARTDINVSNVSVDPVSK